MRARDVPSKIASAAEVKVHTKIHEIKPTYLLRKSSCPGTEEREGLTSRRAKLVDEVKSFETPYTHMYQGSGRIFFWTYIRLNYFVDILIDSLTRMYEHNNYYSFLFRQPDRSFKILKVCRNKIKEWKNFAARWITRFLKHSRVMRLLMRPASYGVIPLRCRYTYHPCTMALYGEYRPVESETHLSEPVEVNARNAIHLGKWRRIDDGKSISQPGIIQLSGTSAL